MPSAARPWITELQLSSLTRELLGQEVAELLFESGYASAVFGVQLRDGNRVVVKVRRWHERLIACTTVQRHLADGGFPCPRPLVGPLRRGTVGLSIEEFVPGGRQLPREQAAWPLAVLLSHLIRCAPPVSEVPGLAPVDGFLRWRDGGRPLWPPAADTTMDLNDPALGAEWIDHAAHQVRARLAEVDLPDLVGHGDWWSNNIRWANGGAISVDDWDSAVALPEAAIVGAAAALFADGESTVAETAEFIATYRRASGHLASADEQTTAWAAGLWARLFDAKKALALGFPLAAERLRGELAERARNAGLSQGE